jgi:hypothetical protein
MLAVVGTVKIRWKFAFSAEITCKGHPAFKIGMTMQKLQKKATVKARDVSAEYCIEKSELNKISRTTRPCDKAFVHFSASKILCDESALQESPTIVACLLCCSSFCHIQFT